VTLKAAQWGGAPVSVASESRSGKVLVEFRDTGGGASQEILARMFEPTFTTKEKKGTGLGLAFVQQVLSHAGGEVAVESSPGQGLTVRLYLPVIG
jgi:signal transduction histidine kinase